MKDFIAANADWLTVFQLPTYAPDLNPTEGIWSPVGRRYSPVAISREPSYNLTGASALNMFPYSCQKTISMSTS